MCASSIQRRLAVPKLRSRSQRAQCPKDVICALGSHGSNKNSHPEGAEPSSPIPALDDSKDSFVEAVHTRPAQDKSVNQKLTLQVAPQKASPVRKLIQSLRAMRSKRKRYDPYNELRGDYDLPKLKAFFKRRPAVITRRLGRITLVALRVWRVWRSQENTPLSERTRGAVLRDALTELGPVFVKCGQTMSERPDVVGEEAADAMKSLQSQNKPFPNSVAYRIILEDLAWEGPLASNFNPDGRVGKPLFAEFEPQPVAAASLGQVYKARTWEGSSVAVKVQRPNMIRRVSVDMYSLRRALETLRTVMGFKRDITTIADEVGMNIFKELDYHLEARNAREFDEKHAFLGFITTPKMIPEYTGPVGTARVLTMEWINGKSIRDLERDDQVKMVQMAVEASVAQLIRTGFVHADPHEGNMMLTDDGRLAFLDFGLMCTVETRIMESFASGICNLLAGNWVQLAYDFREVGIAPAHDFERFSKEEDKFVTCNAEEYAEGIKKAITGEADGMTRFGALATGLGSISFEYRFECPPYIVLLCRTFLTLEGIASVVDPDFSIYTASLPYAVRRALSPQTSRGVNILRQALLTEEGEFRVDQLSEVLEMTTNLAQTESSTKTLASSTGEWDTVCGLFGSLEGATLRRITWSADSVSLANYLVSPRARPLRRQSEAGLASFLSEWHASRHRKEGTLPTVILGLPPSQKELTRRRVAMRVIVLGHLQRLLLSGPRGIFSLVCLGWTVFRIGVMGMLRALHTVIAKAALDLLMDAQAPSAESQVAPAN